MKEQSKIDLLIASQFLSEYSLTRLVYDQVQYAPKIFSVFSIKKERVLEICPGRFELFGSLVCHVLGCR